MLVIIAVAGLIVLFVWFFSNRQKELDLSLPYTPSASYAIDQTLGKTFAQDLVISAPSVTIEGVKLDSTKEKGLLFDLDSRESLFAQGIFDRAYPASITKLMTAIICAKYGNMSDSVTMEEADFDLEEGSQVSGLIPGDTVTLEQLFYSLVVYSANDAANAIARHIDGSTEMFVQRMNLEAEAIGMKNTHFVNAHGLHDKEHYTTAYDIYLMLNEAIRYQVFLDAVRLSVYHLTVQRGEDSIMYDLNSTDHFLTGDEHLPAGVQILAGKTGTTDEAGSCLALAVQDQRGIPYIAIILNAENKTALYTDMNQLLGSIASH